MFRLNKISNENKDEIIISLNDNWERDNYYSVITGENGCGKSSLLRKAVNNYIFGKSKTTEDCKADYDSDEVPSRVIAICNARYNKFPLKKTFIERSNLLYPNYYIQAEHDQDVGKSLIIVVRDSIREVISNGGQESLKSSYGVSSAFKMIGLRARVKMKLRFNAEFIEGIKERLKNDKGYNKNNVDESLFKEFLHWKKLASINDYMIDELLTKYEIAINVRDTLGDLDFLIDDKEYKIKSNGIEPYLLNAGISLGFIIPFNLQVQGADSLKWVSNHSISSGQQSMVLNAIIISSFAKKNALICIDEPENSLHPEWQLDFMKFLEKLCLPNLGCHFIIATHSPQIISGMQSDNGCIIALKKHNSPIKLNDFQSGSESSDTLYNTKNQDIYSVKDFRRRSADRQLIDIFKSPGYNNETAVHGLIIILTKLKRALPLTEKDYEFLSEISDFIRIGKIDEYDPVNIIFEQAASIIKIRGKQHDY